MLEFGFLAKARSVSKAFCSYPQSIQRELHAAGKVLKLVVFLFIIHSGGFASTGKALASMTFGTHHSLTSLEVAP